MGSEMCIRDSVRAARRKALAVGGVGDAVHGLLVPFERVEHVARHRVVHEHAHPDRGDELQPICARERSATHSARHAVSRPVPLDQARRFGAETVRAAGAKGATDAVRAGSTLSTSDAHTPFGHDIAGGNGGNVSAPVSYTHLTLPTICSV